MKWVSAQLGHNWRGLQSPFPFSYTYGLITEAENQIRDSHDCIALHTSIQATSSSLPSSSSPITKGTEAKTRISIAVENEK